MNFKQELFEKYEIRKNKEQKTDFIDWVSRFAKDRGFNVNVHRGGFGTRNIVVGEINQAKVVYTAHYDTCANMIIPNFITPRNIWLYLLYQLCICLIVFTPAILFICLGTLFGFEDVELLQFIGSLITLVILILMMVGPANKHTANDNTSGVATLLQIIDTIDELRQEDVAFVFFDLEEAGLLGSTSFASKYKKQMKDKLVVNYDCVSDGEKMLFVLNKKTKAFESVFNDAFKSNDKVETIVVSKGVFYPSDQVVFPLGVGVCSMKTNKYFKSGYIDRIHTNKDTVFRDENIIFLAQCSIELIDKLQ